MMFRWFAPTSREANIDSLYGTIVAQARNPAFYQSYGVPDTVTARLEMIMLHAILVLRRLKDGKVFDFVSRATPTGGKDVAYLNALFKIF